MISRKIVPTLLTMALTGWSSIVVSMVHEHGDPFKLFVPSAFSLVLAIPTWVVVSFFLGQVVRHALVCKCQNRSCRH